LALGVLGLGIATTTALVLRRRLAAE
jgi:hypothetical protein